MELEEMKIAWSELGRRLDQRDVQVAELRYRHSVLGLQSRLRLMTRGHLIQLAIGLLLTFWGGSTWPDHWGKWHIVAYGIALHLYGLVLIWTAAVQLRRVMAIDYSGSVATIQAGIVRLKRSRLRTERILTVIGGMAWVPALFLLLYYAGLDVWMSKPGVVIANLTLGVAASAALLWSSWRHPEWFERTAQHRHLAEIERELFELGGLTRD